MVFHVEKVCRAGHRFITDTKTILFPFTTFSVFLQSPPFHLTIDDKVVKCKLFFPTHKHLYKMTIQNSKNSDRNLEPFKHQSFNHISWPSSADGRGSGFNTGIQTFNAVVLRTDVPKNVEVQYSKKSYEGLWSSFRPLLADIKNASLVT